MMFCKHCNKEKPNKDFRKSKATVRFNRTGRVCIQCGYDRTNELERLKTKKRKEQYLLNEYGTLNKKIIANIQRYERRIRNNKIKRDRYANGYAEKQKKLVKSWISRNRDKHAVYVKNWQNKQRRRVNV